MTTPEQPTLAPLELQDNAAVGAHDSDARLTATRFAPVIAAAQEPPFADCMGKRPSCRWWNSAG